MLLQRRTLELAATAVSLAAGCIPCTNYHIREAKNAGAGEDEIKGALLSGMNISGFADREMEQKFLHKTQAGKSDELANHANGKPKYYLLGLVGAAVARNSVHFLKTAIALAKRHGVSEPEILEIIVLSQRIKEKAASHLERLVNSLEADPEQAASIRKLCT